MKDIGMESYLYDIALCYNQFDKELIGVCGTYVDDTLHVGTKEYRQLARKRKRSTESHENGTEPSSLDSKWKKWKKDMVFTRKKISLS